TCSAAVRVVDCGGPGSRGGAVSRPSFAGRLVRTVRPPCKSTAEFSQGLARTSQPHLCRSRTAAGSTLSLVQSASLAPSSAPASATVRSSYRSATTLDPDAALELASGYPACLTLTPYQVRIARRVVHVPRVEPEVSHREQGHLVRMHRIPWQ